MLLVAVQDVSARGGKPMPNSWTRDARAARDDEVAELVDDHEHDEDDEQQDDVDQAVAQAAKSTSVADAPAS